MTIRDLFHAFAQDTTATVEIIDQNYHPVSDGPIYFDFRMERGCWDEDIEILEKYADRLIDEWYVTITGVIRIRIYDEI